MNPRRRFLGVLAALCGSSLGAPAPSRAAGPARVAIFSPTTPTGYQVQERAFIGAMRDLGWVEGRNIVYDRVYSNDDYSRMPALAAELISRSPQVIWLTSNTTAVAMAQKTRSIPIVGGAFNNPVELGLVKSLGRPGGNVTGIKNIGWELAGKRLQFLKQVLPNAKRVLVLADVRQSTTPLEVELLHTAAAPLGISVAPVVIADLGTLEAAVAELGKPPPDAVLTSHTALLLNERKRIIAFAAKRHVPVIGHRGQMADDGALLAYSSLLTEQIRRSAYLVDRILKGANPAEIPVEQPTKFELVINLKTAKALGLKIPEQLLVQADRVIQ